MHCALLKEYACRRERLDSKAPVSPLRSQTVCPPNPGSMIVVLLWRGDSEDKQVWAVLRLA